MENFATQQPEPPGGVPALRQAQDEPLFGGAGKGRPTSAEWVHTGTGEGIPIDYDALVTVVVRPGNCWRTTDKEYRPGEVFQVTRGELAANPSCLQLHEQFLAEQARASMLAPAQQAARERAARTRAGLAQQQDRMLTTKEAESIAERRKQWMRDEAARATTREALDALRAAESIDEETYRERLVQLIPAIPAGTQMIPVP